MRLLKYILVIYISVNTLIYSSTTIAISNTNNTKDDWRYLIREENIGTMSIDVNSIAKIQPTSDAETATDNTEEKDTNELAQIIDFSFIKFEAKTPIVKGFAILVNDYAQPRKIDINLMFLAKNLPEHGYHTILVDYDKRLIDLFTESAQNQRDNTSTISEQEKSSESTENEAADDNSSSTIQTTQTGLNPNVFQATNFEFSEQNYNQALALILTSIEKEYLEQPGYRLYISSGMSAFSLLKVFSEDSKLNADAIAISNPFWPDYKINKEISQSVAKLKIPVLDLISAHTNIWSNSTSEYRKIAAIRAFLPFYRQKKLADGALNITQMEYEKKEIMSWLKYLGW